MSHKKLPKKISEIIKETPYSYSFLVVSDYLNNRVSANELYRRYKNDKKQNKNEQKRPRI